MVATRTRRSARRTEALSRDRIVEAAVELLVAAGEGGLTFRALTERLATRLATQLARSPWRSVTPRILESIGRQVRALGVPEGSWFTATFALVPYVLGTAGQNAANAVSPRLLGPDVDRAEFLDAASTAWEELDPDDYPFTRAVADQVRDHDDRAEFLAGSISSPPASPRSTRAPDSRSDRGI
jgi:hypothetical protein